MGRAWWTAVLSGSMLACGSGSVEVERGADETPVEAPEPAPVPAADAPKEKEPEPEPSAGGRGKLLSLEQGDVACYVELQTKGQGRRTLHGDFELCTGGGADASALVGKAVRFRTGWTTVQADTCEGDPECTDTQKVELVTALRAAK